MSKELQLMKLENKVSLVTGGSRGIGAAICRYLGYAGAKVAINYLQSKEKAEAVADEIRGTGGEAYIFRTDVTKSEQVKEMFSKVKEQLGPIEILVNNAAIWKPNPITDFSEEEMERTLDLNLKAYFYCCEHVMPHFKEIGRGNIINISGGAGQTGEKYMPHYSAAKGGVIALTKALAKELGPLNIRVNAVAPGWTYSDLSKETFSDEKTFQAILSTKLLGRVAEPEEIAGPVLFLASDLSRHMTGQVIAVNGGSIL
ncbi:MAG: SDR family NAD(P)-dependent oxidoreductase [Candidatus Hodarchaeota archaeon]